MNKQNAIVAVYDTHEAAEAAIKKLDRSGFDMTKLSIIGQDYHSEENVVGYYNTGDRMKFWGKLGAFWGGLVGLLFGSAFLVLPGIGHLIVLGPLVSWIANGVAGATVAGGLSVLAAGLVSIGIPKNSVIKYEEQLKTGKFLLLAHGTPEQVEEARRIIEGTDATTTDIYEVNPEPAAEATT